MCIRFRDTYTCHNTVNVAPAEPLCGPGLECVATADCPSYQHAQAQLASLPRRDPARTRLIARLRCCENTDRCVTIPVCICEQEHGVQPGQEAGVLCPGRAAARVAA